ncbi:hypothetical protein OEZ86_009816 [Tetradesmus obliquus]|uniref:Mitochondrial carrier protein n=1 Tax=Tetradesmus obliquus TaxID=3088 RepID=A0ABY8UN50_TETOB|nr:hypothetical protein OEZ85_001257 [Tetradesmus obliquus]WIA43318.1 hypothetical protein OEZ86_009816 [Tetradesmus obliquus]
MLGGPGSWSLRLASSVSARHAVVATAAAAVGSVAYVRTWHPKTIPLKDPSKQNLVLDRPLMEAMCGAIGEVAQICVMYPLETIKVRCQSDGIAAATVLQQLLAKGAPSAARVLYAGFLSAALSSILVGSVHYASFCISKRMALQAAGSNGSSSDANLLAATVGALATALVESPVEMFRHQAQAGVGNGNFLSEMVTSMQKHGPGALYWGFVPFLIESFPYDITELGTYSQLHDMREEALRKSSPGSKWMAQVPEQAWDIGIGAAAGVASVLVSMPFDVIKTYMQTHCAEAAAAGAGGQLAAFFATGSRMVAAGGPGALFVGLVPRLVQQVPSTTICWWAIEQARDMLEPYTKP